MGTAMNQRQAKKYLDGSPRVRKIQRRCYPIKILIKDIESPHERALRQKSHQVFKKGSKIKKWTRDFARSLRILRYRPDQMIRFLPMAWIPFAREVERRLPPETGASVTSFVFVPMKGPRPLDLYVSAFIEFDWDKNAILFINKCISDYCKKYASFGASS